MQEVAIIRRVVLGAIETLNMEVDGRECLAVYANLGLANRVIEGTDHAPRTEGWRAISVEPGQLLTILGLCGVEFVALPEKPDGTLAWWGDGADFARVMGEL